MNKRFKGVAVGAGYFSHFQYEAWNRIPEVEITALCNRDAEKGKEFQEQYNIANHYVDYQEMIDKEQPDFIDIITPPETHVEMCKYAADRGVDIICQKPLAPTFEEGKEIVDYVKKAGVRFMVHENWRFQPWHREIKRLIDQKAVGEVHTINFRKRMGDGWGEDAYIPRQPYFRDYPRLIVYENGIHFIDTFRYLAGEVDNVYAKLRKLNPVIAGEDWAIVHFEFENGINAVWDANRYNEPNYDNPRYTFGEMLVDGFEGSIRLYSDGRITIQKLGEEERLHDYHHEVINFSGDCVYTCQRHFIDGLISGDEFETNGEDYLKSLAVQEAVYQSGGKGEVVRL
ncbi:MAG: Gfo/Idh/MocA family oxidoreductase [Cyclobacteriaceae bacterium]